MAAPDQVLRLIEKFQAGESTYRAPTYKEAAVRNEFLDRFFVALGWDVGNTKNALPANREVIIEPSIEMEDQKKAPDYSFLLDGKDKFFVEAKKPYVKIETNRKPALQLRSYGWTAQHPLGILTDFEEFIVYDCRIPPDKLDEATVARVMAPIHYTQYDEKWLEIEALFSRDAVLGGSLEQYAQEANKKGVVTVDAAFLKTIDGWRELLARNIAIWNEDIDQRELNYAVQMTLDRLVFLRIAEDRDIEPYGRLQGLLRDGDVYKRLIAIFKDADDRYNSGLFHFDDERGRDLPDTLTPSLYIDDETLKKIIRGMYRPESPYAFRILPVEVLGQVYEQFLGKVITIGADRKADVDFKPEVRKAGGVYYTPQYIVEYIVKNTVGKLLEGKTPKQVDQLRIVDPACGSGSFLLGAYQFLLDWYLNQYVADKPAKRKKEVYQTANGEWKLTGQERKRILLTHIHGVDLDQQAVEVTKLSLSLKVLEGETAASVVQLRFARERALPDLDKNIKCGNALIGYDYQSDDELVLRQVNPFDWEAEFPEIMGAGGFDVVIGNPPYLNIDDTWGKGDLRQRYIKTAYSDVYNDKTDILFYFLAKGAQIAKGEVSFIVSRAFLEAYKADKLRGWLAQKTDIREIVDFRNYYVFKGVGITTAIVSLTKDSSLPTAEVYRLVDEDKYTPGSLAVQKCQDGLFQRIEVDQQAITSSPWLFAAGNIDPILQKIDTIGVPIGDILVIGQGMQTGRNDVFGKLDRSVIQQWGLEQEQYFIRARNSDIQRYHIIDSGEVLLYVEDAKALENLPYGVQEHLKAHEDVLKERAAYQRGNCDWWRYTWPLHKDYLRRPKLYCPYLASNNRFALDEKEEFLGLTDTTVLYDDGQPEQLHYLMGLLNSGGVPYFT